MTLDEFRRHPAYDYYIRTLVSNCLICELDFINLIIVLELLKIQKLLYLKKVDLLEVLV